MTQERFETVTAERVRTAVTISADTGHPCRFQIINLAMKTVPSECPGDSRHGMAQRGQEGWGATLRHLLLGGCGVLTRHIVLGGKSMG